MWVCYSWCKSISVDTARHERGSFSVLHPIFKIARATFSSSSNLRCSTRPWWRQAKSQKNRACYFGAFLYKLGRVARWLNGLWAQNDNIVRFCCLWRLCEMHKHCALLQASICVQKLVFLYLWTFCCSQRLKRNFTAGLAKGPIQMCVRDLEATFANAVLLYKPPKAREGREKNIANLTRQQNQVQFWHKIVHQQIR